MAKNTSGETVATISSTSVLVSAAMCRRAVSAERSRPPRSPNHDCALVVNDMAPSSSLQPEQACRVGPEDAVAIAGGQGRELVVEVQRRLAAFAVGPVRSEQDVLGADDVDERVERRL